MKKLIFILMLGLLFIHDASAVEMRVVITAPVDTTPPGISTPADQTIEQGAVGNITWIITEANPGYYWVLRNGAQVVAPTTYVSGAGINVSINTTALGYWNYTIVANDTSGNTESDQVNVSVQGETVPPNVNITAVNITKGNESFIVVPNQTEVDISANETINGTIAITTESNLTRLNESIAPANKTYGLQDNEVSLDRYVEINVTNITAGQLSYVNLSIFYSSADLDLNGNGMRDAGDIDESTLKIYWWNNKNRKWLPLDPKGTNYSDQDGPEVREIFKADTTAPYPFMHKLKVKLNHFSTFALIGSVASAGQVPSGGHGNGAGGGGVVTTEPFDNIVPTPTPVVTVTETPAVTPTKTPVVTVTPVKPPAISPWVYALIAIVIIAVAVYFLVIKRREEI